MTLHFVNVCLFILFCFYVGTNHVELSSDPIYWSAPNIKHYCIAQLFVSVVIIVVDTATLAWFEKTYLEASEKTYDAFKENFKLNF